MVCLISWCLKVRVVVLCQPTPRSIQSGFCPSATGPSGAGVACGLAPWEPWASVHSFQKVTDPVLSF